MDDVHGSGVNFRVCFDGETFCRPEVYFSHAEISGTHPKVTVVPNLFGATHGAVIVR